MPYTRFKEINDQVKALKEWRDKHGWAEQFQSDPYTFVDSWMDQLAQHPEYSPKLLAKAARMLQARRGLNVQPQTPEEPQADIPVTDGDGRVVNQVYSAAQLRKWHEWNAAQQDAKIAERLSPLEQMHQQIQQAHQQAEAQQRAIDTATTRLAALRQNPLFVEHEAKVKAALIAHEEWGDDIGLAFAHVLATEVLPARDATTLATLKQHAAASTVAPNGQVGTTMPKLKNFEEALRYFDAHPEARPTS